MCKKYVMIFEENSVPLLFDKKPKTCNCNSPIFFVNIIIKHKKNFVNTFSDTYVLFFAFLLKINRLFFIKIVFYNLMT